MSNVVVDKVPEKNQESPLSPETLELLAGIPRRAFELFELRGGGPGDDVADWLQAESEVFQIPNLELAEENGEFHVQVALPGFDAKDVRVAALPDALIVEGESSHKHSGTDGTAHCEFDERRIFRQIHLPEPVDVDRVSATLENDVLQIRAVKAGQSKRRKTSV